MIMDRLIVVYDSCVLYPFYLRDFFMHLALTDLFQAKWTNDIHEEWIRNVLIDKAHLKREQLMRIRQMMDENTRDCLVTGYDSLINDLSLPDPNDRHVLAAAISSSASIIVTANIKDFPKENTIKYGIEAQHPDDFVSQLLDVAPGIVCGAIKRLRSFFKNPSIDVNSYLDILTRQALPKSATRLREFSSLM